MYITIVTLELNTSVMTAVHLGNQLRQNRGCREGRSLGLGTPVSIGKGGSEGPRDSAYLFCATVWCPDPNSIHPITRQ